MDFKLHVSEANVVTENKFRGRSGLLDPPPVTTLSEAQVSSKVDG